MDDTNSIARGPDLLDLKKMLKALGDEARLAMLAALAATDEVTVTDLGQMLAARGQFISQPLVSWHVSVLRRNGLIRTRRFGRQVYCSLDRARYDHCQRMLAELVAPGSEPYSAATSASDPSAGILGRSL